MDTTRRGTFTSPSPYMPPDSISIHPELNVFDHFFTESTECVEYLQWDLICDLGRPHLLLMSVE